MTGGRTADYTQVMHPTQLGPYAIQSRLGRGGMGAVYEAIDTTNGATVAVKILASHLADDPGLRRRFNAEIETLKELRHPSIVQLLAFGEQDGQPYFAMEMVRGRSLEQLLRSGRRFTWRETVAVALEITRALKVAHDHGVVHRDLKPANLLVPDDPADGAAGGGIKLADFGIARLFGGQQHTAHGTVVGTAEYMAPEQAAGLPVDHRADLYNLGLVMFAMLAGRPPFSGAEILEVIRKQRQEAPRRIASIVPEVPPELDALIDRLLAKDPAKRPASGLATGRLLTAIATVTGDADAAAPAPAADSAERLVLDETAFREASTGLDRSNKPTRADAAAARAVGAGAGADVDLLAPTRDFSTEPAASATSRLAATAGGSVGLPSAVAAATTQVDRAPRNRFMTVEELDRANREQEGRERLRQRRLQIATSIAIVSLVAAAGFYLLKPRTADDLHDSIMEIASDGTADLRDARDSIEEFLGRHADDPRAAGVRALDRRLDLESLEKRARRRVRGDRTLPPIERDYRAAMAREDESPSACRAALEALMALHAPAAGDSTAAAADPGRTAPNETSPGETGADETVDLSLWIALARRQIDRLGPAAECEQQEDARRIEEVLAEAASLAEQAAGAEEGPQRAALIDRRRKLLESTIEIYAGRAHAAKLVAAARRQLAKEETQP